MRFPDSFYKSVIGHYKQLIVKDNSMNMKRMTLIVLAVILACGTASGWGREGHEVIAKIAENHLQPSAKKTIEKYLGDHSIVYFAKWMDEYRHTKEYAFTSPWHTAKVNENLEYVPSGAKGDAIFGIQQAIETLKNYKELPDSTVSVNIKYLIHLVGDMHCPAHISYSGRSQGFKVDFGDNHYLKPKETISYHSVWDYAVIQSSRIWSVTEYARELDRKSKKEIEAITAGTPEQWFHDNASRCIVQFDMASPGDALLQDFVNEALPLIETQMLYAGYRLAAVLNGLF